jgi:KRAB domain-containing zinc finger protein
MSGEHKEASKVKVLMPVYKFKCAYCEDSFRYRQSLSRHIKENHCKESDKYTCDFCKLEFTRKESRDRHILSKSCLKSFSTIHQCKNCKKSFNELSKLKVHVEKNCDKKYFCNICCKFFKKKSVFKSHEH